MTEKLCRFVEVMGISHYYCEKPETHSIHRKGSARFRHAFEPPKEES